MPLSSPPLVASLLLIISAWLYQKTVQKVIVVIANASTGETVERWQFDIECDKNADDQT